MISDVISDAIADIEEYLADPEYTDIYSGTVKDEIMNLLTHMDQIRMELDKNTESLVD